MSDLNVLREIIAGNFTDEWKPLGLGILDELAAARAVVSYTRMLVKALEEGRSTTNKLAQTAASLQDYDKVRGKGEA